MFVNANFNMADVDTEKARNRNAASTFVNVQRYFS